MTAIQPRQIGATQPTNVSFTFPMVACLDFICVRFQLQAALTSTPVGTFKLQGSEDALAITDANNGTSLAQWTDLTLPAGSVHGTAASFVFSGPAVTAAWDGTAALNALIDVANPPSYMRLVWTRSGGGSTTASLLCRVGARGQRV